jgi:hypothetical protein
MDQQFQRDAMGQIDRHGMQAVEFAFQCMQAQRWMKGIGLQQLQSFQVLRAQGRMLLEKTRGAFVVLLRENRRIAHFMASSRANN